MPFKFSDSHIESYHQNGFAVFEGIIPPSLLTDLRRALATVWEKTRELRGADGQRLQPLVKHGFDPGVFEDYAELPELREAVSAVLSPQHMYWNPDICGALIEPGENAWCTEWHRDWRRDKVPGGDLPDWDDVFMDINCFNQINCPLYDDSCTWVVPGSQKREDVPGEADLVLPILDGKTPTERERLCMDYCRSMPGSVCLHLAAGDFALYRNTLWHIGNYAPYRKRATLHDLAETPEWAAWRKKVSEETASRRNTE